MSDIQWDDDGRGFVLSGRRYVPAQDFEDERFVVRELKSRLDRVTAELRELKTALSDCWSCMPRESYDAVQSTTRTLAMRVHDEIDHATG